MVFALMASVRPKGMVLSAFIERVTVCSLPLKLVMNTGTSKMSPSVRKRGNVACIVRGSLTRTSSSPDANRVGDAVQAMTRTEPLYCGISNVADAFPSVETSTNPDHKATGFTTLALRRASPPSAPPPGAESIDGRDIPQPTVSAVLTSSGIFGKSALDGSGVLKFVKK